MLINLPNLRLRSPAGRANTPDRLTGAARRSSPGGPSCTPLRGAGALDAIDVVVTLTFDEGRVTSHSSMTSISRTSTSPSPEPALTQIPRERVQEEMDRGRGALAG